MEFLNKILEVIFKLSLYGTITSIAILIFKKLFDKKINAKFHYMIWFILLIRILVPFMPESYISVYNKTKEIENKFIDEGPREFLFDKPSYEDIYKEALPGLEGQNVQGILKEEPSATKSFEIKDKSYIISILYLIVAIFIFLYYLLGYIILNLKVRKYKRCEDEDLIKILNKCKRILKIDKKIEIFINKNNESPMIFGVIKPKIVIPISLLSGLKYENLEFILLHELFHYKKLDLLFNWIINISSAIYWFNPVILFSLKQMKNDCEKKTDEYVICNLTKEEQINYGKTILYVVENISLNQRIIGTSTILGGKNEMKKRINSIINFRKPAVISTAVFIGASIIMGTFLLTNSRASSSDEDNTAKNTTSNTTSLVSNLNETKEDISKLYEKYAPQDVIDSLNELQSKLPSKDDIDKDSMIKKMFNTGAYVASATGEFEVLDKRSGIGISPTINDGNIKYNTKYYTKISKDKKILNYDITTDAGYVTSSLKTPDDLYYRLNDVDKTYVKYNSNYAGYVDNILSKNPIVDPKNIHTIDKQGYDVWGESFGPISGKLSAGVAVLSPRELYTGFFIRNSFWDVASKDSYKGDTWDITSTEDYLGFKCVVIEGTLEDDSYSEKLQTKRFKFWVDSATGVLLKYEMYNKNGELSQALDTKKLEINKIIPDSVFQVDLTEYTDKTPPPFDPNVDNRGISEEMLNLEKKITGDVSKKVLEDKYKDMIKFYDSSFTGSESPQLLIKLYKEDEATSQEDLKSLREELKEIILNDIKEANIEVSEIFFIIYDKDGKKDIKQYTISIEGKAQGWNTNKGN